MKAVNLLPPDVRGASRPATTAGVVEEPVGRTGAFAVLGVLAFCVVALAAYVLTSNTISDRRAQLDQVTAQADATSAAAARLKPYADFAAQASERVQTVKDLAADRFDWEQALRDVSRAVPARVTLSALDASIAAGSGGAGGGAGGALRSAIASPAIEMEGCTIGGQRDVATLLSRLRDVDGVTRVSLESTERPAPGTQVASTTAVGSDSGPVGCGKGRPATFSLVIFFEHSTVSSSVQEVGTPTTGTTGTTGTPTAATGTTPTATTAATTAAATPTATPATSTTTTP
jgi:Tfp pilus assembly protein PilN